MQPENFLEKERQEVNFRHPETVVEIGATDNILDAYYLRNWSDFDKNKDVYVALNIINHQGSLNGINYQLSDKNIKGAAIQADAANMPFGDKSVDKLVLNDVLNSFRLPNADPDIEKLFVNDGIHPTFADSDEMLAAMRQIFNDCKRIVKENGEILIVMDLPDASDGMVDYFIEGLKTSESYEIIKQPKLNIEPDGKQTNSEVITIKFKLP